MSIATIQERILKLITNRYDVADGKATPDATLQDMGIDSLESVELIMAIEQEFNVEIPDEDVGDLETAAKMAAYLDARAA